MDSLRQVTRTLDRAIKRETKRQGIFARDAVVKKITDQDPRWEDLAETTIARKGSSKALIDHGDLRNAITYKLVDRTTVFVGVLRQARKKSGEEGILVNIARIHEFGFVGMVTNSRTGTTYGLRIPARPYLFTTMAEIEDKLRKGWNRAIAEAIEDAV